VLSIAIWDYYNNYTAITPVKVVCIP